MRDILDGIRVIEEYVHEMTYERFVQDRKTVDAVVRNLITIGEAASNVPAEVQERYAEIPWDNMRRMRNIIVHVYFGVNLPVVWRTIQEDLPPLKAQLGKVLRDAGNDN
jgi:uncharacterized protein with HEPN domain